MESRSRRREPRCRNDLGNPFGAYGALAAWRITFIVSLFLAAFASLASAQNLSIATGGTGGVYYPMGGGVAAVLSKFVPGMQATAEVTGGSVDNLKLVGSGKPYIGFSMADAALDAYAAKTSSRAARSPSRR
ncbi:MAG: TAXI family TRAP transporter solute-binding subunit [Rubrivivax sp.]